MLITDLPRAQVDLVLNQEYCDIDQEFFGFVDIYEHLANIIPLHFDIIDFGCAYNPQCFLFKNHHSLHSIDLPGRDGCDVKRFKTDNCIIYEMQIQHFIQQYREEFDQSTTFAICSYVPDWYGKNSALVRHNFENVFIFYPSRRNDGPKTII